VNIATGLVGYENDALVRDSRVKVVIWILVLSAIRCQSSKMNAPEKVFEYIAKVSKANKTRIPSSLVENVNDEAISFRDAVSVGGSSEFWLDLLCSLVLILEVSAKRLGFSILLSCSWWVRNGLPIRGT
jgi:hypothetical protein